MAKPTNFLFENSESGVFLALLKRRSPLMLSSRECFPVKRWQLILAAILLLAWLTPVIRAQKESVTPGNESPVDPKQTTRVVLGNVSGPPGQSIVVPIYFTPAEGIKVGGLELVVDFISANLKFNRLDAAIAAEMANVQLKAETKQGKNDKGVETSTVRITASLPSSPASETGIPSGLLAYLTLQVGDDARPASITLGTTAKATELKTNNPIRNLQVIEAKVDVMVEGDSAPAVVCFFFTH